MAKPIPDGYPAVIPFLIVDGAARAIEFYKNVFGATERMRLPGPGDKLAHAEIVIGDSVIMLADASPESGTRAPQTPDAATVRLHIYLDDVDAAAARAVAAGAKILIPIADQFYGDRSGRIADPFGHVWLISTHTEDIAPEEMQRRMEEFTKKAAG
jgi:PhnB protein